MKQNLEKGHKKLLFAWAFYGWANSVYTLVIASAIFPIFYALLFSSAGVDSLVIFGFQLQSTPIIIFSSALAFLIVTIISPPLSGIADYLGNKKRFMQFFCYLGSLSCIGLYWFSLENIYVSLLCYMLALIGFWTSFVFYNSYLPDIAYKDQQDSVSARGFSLGYIGSVLLLIFNLWMVLNPSFFGFGQGEDAVLLAMKTSFVTVGIWWALFSQYTFYYLPKNTKNGNKLNTNVVFNGFKELFKIQRELVKNKQLKAYLVAFFVYSMAVQTVLLVATYFGEQEINWPNAQHKSVGLIVSILIIQFLAVIGAETTARLSAKWGNIKMLIVLNAIWLVLCIIAFTITLPIHFYLVAAFVGLVIGGIQSLSRSTYSKLLPETDDTTSYFSFFDVSEKIGIVIGMMLYGIINHLTGSLRFAILFLVLFFLLGIILLVRVPNRNKI